jgi:hypothetical protein
MGITKKQKHADFREKHLEMMPKTPKKHPKIAALRVMVDTFSCNPPHLSTLPPSVRMLLQSIRVTQAPAS